MLFQKQIQQTIVSARTEIKIFSLMKLKNLDKKS